MTPNTQINKSPLKLEVRKGLGYNPDVLNCIANLSNDEVFTPPELANKMLDLLPEELFCSPKTTFLDPFTKSGVFLREIVKRLDRGLTHQIPDRQQRIDHILHNQVFGIACTELTSLLARRSVYCSKYANSKYSVSQFDNEAGNIIYSNIRHTWVNGKCKYCGASQSVYDRGSEAEQYAYQFIHTDNPKKFFSNMKFDVIVGNPPYQMNDGGGSGSSAKPIYDKFVQQAQKLKPRYIALIIPSRWMTGGKGLDNFRSEMITDRHIRVLHDFLDASQCFAGVNIEGGVCYFKWDLDNQGPCKYYLHQANNNILQTEKMLDEDGMSDIVIRDPNLIGILNKVQSFKENTFDTLVLPRNPFAIKEDISNYITNKKTSRRILLRQNSKREILSLKDDFSLSRGNDFIGKYKLFVSKADGAAGQIGNPIPARIIGKAEFGEKDMICSETFLAIGPFADKNEALVISDYMRTKFFRLLVGIRKNKNMTQKTYSYVPLQDFSHPWTDEMLYKKYNLTEEEIAFIESMIRPME